MSLSDEVRRLSKRWQSGNGWPKRLEWLSIQGLRGWDDQRVEFNYPIVAVSGENGSGKSTILQAAASAYRSQNVKETPFASDHFPKTHWDKLEGIRIKYGCLEGGRKAEHNLRKPTTKWLGYIERPIREVKYIDLSRIQPVSVRPGYAKIAKNKHVEESAIDLSPDQVQRLSQVMGKQYDGARMAIADIGPGRAIPIISKSTSDHSGFHLGSGETTVMELLLGVSDLPKCSLVLIDEIESSLHPRAQRRLIRDLAERCRDRDVQVILTTHSPYVLEELPVEARLYILQDDGTKKIMPGVSPQFAMTKMDDEPHPECDLYVEDAAAKTLLEELLAFHAREFFVRCNVIPFGAANVGYALGQMVENKRFPRPSCVFVDGDGEDAPGCIRLPGGDAPERVVFKDLKDRNWGNLWSRLARDVSLVADSCANAMTLADHHDWVRLAANKMMCGGEPLWRSMCAEWVQKLPKDDPSVVKIVKAVEDALA